MIPKKIHYCWFGHNPLNEKAKRCIASWKKYCPDYEIIEWNESNYDVYKNGYTKKAYDNKKFAFLSDFARLEIIYNEGGLYFDVDVELIKPFDCFLDDQAFFGFETEKYANTGIGFGAEAKNPIVKQMIEEYKDYLNGSKGFIGCPIVNTRALVKYGMILNDNYQKLGCATVYPSDYFNPYDDPTGKLRKTKNTHSIHWYAKSWMNKKTIIRSVLMRPFHRIFGTKFTSGIKRIFS